MPKLILRCNCEIDGEELAPGAEIEVDEDNAVRMIRKGMAAAAPKKKSAPKKKAKAEVAD